jgi:tRNA(fMet)-specific endonuclease VapC
VIVVDSDVLIDALRGREPALSRVAAGLADRTLVTTTISAFELRSGARSPEQLDAIDGLLGALPLLAFDDAASQAAGRCRRELETKGATIGMGDYLIAGICLSRGASLLTRNRKHFDRLPGLMLAKL